MENCAEKNGSEFSTLQDAQHQCRIDKLWVEELETDNIINFKGDVLEFFEKMDQDFDSKLSFDELMGEDTSLERLFQSMDKYGNGAVTQQVENR
jgi:hypothetical protein